MNKDLIKLKPLRDHLLDNYYAQNEIIDHCNEAMFETDQTDGFRLFFDSIIKKKKVNPNFEIVVMEQRDPLYNISEIRVYITNPEFVCSPPDDLDPYGGSVEEKDDCPEGYYNANWVGYCDFFVPTLTPWEELASADILVETALYEKLGHDPNKVYAEVAWEMTFYDYKEEENRKPVEIAMQRVQEWKERKLETKSFSNVNEFLDEITQEEE